jgi:hypothetical protein
MFKIADKLGVSFDDEGANKNEGEGAKEDIATGEDKTTDEVKDEKTPSIDNDNGTDGNVLQLLQSKGLTGEEIKAIEDYFKKEAIDDAKDIDDAEKNKIKNEGQPKDTGEEELEKKVEKKVEIKNNSSSAKPTIAEIQRQVIKETNGGFKYETSKERIARNNKKYSIN